MGSFSSQHCRAAHNSAWQVWSTQIQALRTMFVQKKKNHPQQSVSTEMAILGSWVCLGL